MSALYVVPNPRSYDSIVEHGARAAAEMRSEGYEPCQGCEDWFPVEGSRRHKPMRKVSRSMWMCARCFAAALEEALNSAESATLLTVESADTRRVESPSTRPAASFSEVA